MPTEAPARRSHYDANQRQVALLREGLAVTIPDAAELQRAAARLLALPDVSLAESVAAGLPLSSLQALAAHLGWKQRQVLDLVGVIPATTSRARRQGRPLDDHLSQALADLALVVVTAESFFSELQAARRWLTMPRETLHNLTPLAFALTPGGAAYIVVLLRRLEYGVYS